jgi:hypothetical protein
VLAELLDALDEKYDSGHTWHLAGNQQDRLGTELAHRVFQCVAVASRPLHIEELA